MAGSRDGTWRILGCGHGSTGAHRYTAAQAFDDRDPATRTRIILVCRIRW